MSDILQSSMSFQQHFFGFAAGFIIPLAVSEMVCIKGSVRSKRYFLTGLGALSTLNLIPLSAKIGAIISGSMLTAEMIRDKQFPVPCRFPFYCSAKLRERINKRAWSGAIIGSINGIAAIVFNWSPPSAYVTGIAMSAITTAVLLRKKT